MNVETLAGTQIFPPGNIAFLNITPDGQYLRCNRWDDKEKGNEPYRYSLETHTWTPLPAGMLLSPYAPNGELLAMFTSTRKGDDHRGPSTALAIMNVTTNRLDRVFDPRSAVPDVEDPPPVIVGAPAWLFNSAGVFVNVRSYRTGIAEHTIWQAGANGEAAAVATGVTVIANSQNGRYWLLEHGQQLYVMTVDTE